VLCRRLPDKALLLDGVSGRCYELNRLGAEVWSLLDGERTLEEVCGCLQEVLEVPSQVLRADVHRFARDLETVGLAQRRP
jgi:Coenzyme PQQ synthesis protein D (PqqD)